MEDVKWLEIAVNTSADKLDAVTARRAAKGRLRRCQYMKATASGCAGR